MHMEYNYLFYECFFFCFSLGRDFTVSCSEDIVIDRDNPKWYYYFLCGVKGIQVRHVVAYAFLICYSAM